MADIHDNIYRLRKYHKLTMEELGKKIGTTKQTIKKYESREIKSIPYDKILALADALETTPAEIMGWTERTEDRMTYADEVAHLRSKYPDIDFVKIDKMVEAYINAEPSIQKAIELMLKV